MDGIPDFTLKIGGMMCQKNCATTVHKAIISLNGVAAVDVSYPRGEALVWGKSVQVSEIIEAVESVGYDAEVAANDSWGIMPVDEDFAVPEEQQRRRSISDEESSIKSPLISSISHSKEYLFEATGMSCANCASKIEKSVSTMIGVKTVNVSNMTNKVRVILDESIPKAVGPRDIVEKIESLGYGCSLSSSVGGSDDAAASTVNEEVAVWWRLLIISLVFGIPVVALHVGMSCSPELMMLLMEPAVCEDSVNVGQCVMLALNTPILLLVGYRYYKAAIFGMLHGSFGMDCLVMTGTSITFMYSCVRLIMACDAGMPTKHVFFDTTGMLLMFVTIGKFIEAYAKGKSASAITNLLKLQVKEALLVTNPESIFQKGTTESAEITKTVHVDLIQKGDVLKVLPGNQIPTDGIVEFGSSHVDESMITGESVAVQKSPGDLVFGSTVNQNHCIYVKVSTLGSESALSQIVKLVEAAQLNKAPVQAYADRVASVFTPIVLFLALMTFVTWCSLSYLQVVPKRWFQEEYNDPLLFSLLFAISVVVISCPCALGLATPTAIMVGTGVGAANGILIKGGGAFEMAHKITTVVFDKTGTLTEGSPCVTDEIPLDELSKDATKLSRSMSSSSADMNALQDARDRLLQTAATAEQMSEHPLANAILKAAQDRKLVLEQLPEDGSTARIGCGVSCDTQVGNRIVVGNRALMEEQHITVTAQVDAAMWNLEVQGKTAICVALNEKIIGIIGVADVAKQEAYSTVATLRNMGLDVWMVTGDNRTTAEALADQLDLPKDRILANALPKDKVAKIMELEASGQFVAMIGDGINDSPALAQANLGVAIGAGTQVAIEAASMVLIRNDLHDLVVALDLAKVVFRRIQWNFMWAIIYNIVAVPFAAGVWFPWTHVLLPPQYAGLAMALSSVSVVLSSMALRWYQRPQFSTEKKLTIVERTKRGLISIKNNIKDKVIRATGSGAQYQKLARNETEADLGLELGLGGTGGFKFPTAQDFEESDGIV